MVIAAGLRPLFADIEGGLYNMTHNTIPKEYWKKAKAMIMTHMYGCPTTVYELLELADRHRVKVIEDCCQSAGAAVFGKMVGSVGYAAIFSTGYTKNLPTLTGGFAVTDDQILANHLKDSRSSHFNPVQELKRSMRSCFYINHFTAPYMYNNLTHFLSSMGIAVGWDFVHEWHKEPVITPTPRIKPPTPHPVQAMLGMKMLATLDHFNKSVAANAEMLLDQIKGIRGVIMPRVTRGHQHIYTGFVLMVDKPWEVKKALMTRGIDTAPGYIMNCAAAPEFSEFNVKCVIAERLQAMRIHIPCYESLYKDQIDDMARAIVHICGR
jgi:dTDP-4-amino-4,6-dideoxygalactose transaminase